MYFLFDGGKDGIHSDLLRCFSGMDNALDGVNPEVRDFVAPEARDDAERAPRGESPA